MGGVNAGFVKHLLCGVWVPSASLVLLGRVCLQERPRLHRCDGPGHTTACAHVALLVAVNKVPLLPAKTQACS